MVASDRRGNVFALNQRDKVLSSLWYAGLAKNTEAHLFW